MESVAKYFRLIIVYLCLLLPIFIGCEQKEDPADPVACFTMSSEEVEVGELIAFKNCSTNAENYSWDFGDGETSTEMAPSHSYSDDGQYPVKLRAYNKGNYHEETKIVTVINGGGGTSLEACFTYEPTTVVVNQRVDFTNCSEGEESDSYEWDFGDGGTSTAENPNHTFTEQGNYTVKLKVSAGSESDQVQKTIQVTGENTEKASVTFLLQMYIPYLWDDFDPEYDNVEIIGNFNNWGSGTQFAMYRMNDTSTIYGITLENFDVNENLEFRFKANTSEGAYEEQDENGSPMIRYHTVSSNPDDNIYADWFEGEQTVWVDFDDYNNGVPINAYSSYYMDDFSASTTKYYTGTGEDYSLTVQNGVYKVENYNADYSKAFTAGVYGPDQTTSFEIEYKMRATTTEVNSGSGYIWGVTDEGSSWEYFTFFMAPDGQYKAGNNGSSWVDWFDWKSGGNSSPNYNKITIRKQGSNYYIFVNEVFSHKEPVTSFYGHRIGIFIAKSNTVEFDYINIRTIDLIFTKGNEAKPIIHPEITIPTKAVKGVVEERLELN